MAEIFVLLSESCHVDSGMPCRSPQDARALEIALNLATSNDKEIEALHAGNPDNPVLREYLGMGLAVLRVVSVPATAEVVMALGAYLEPRHPRLILCGKQAGASESSGMLPYLLARHLAMPVVSDVIQVTLDQDRCHFTQALPHGCRRQLQLRLPAIAAVVSGPDPPTHFSYVQAKRGCVTSETVPFTTDQRPQSWQKSAIKKRVKYIRKPGGTSAAERALAATQTAAGGDKTHLETTPDKSALAILAFLEKTGTHVRSNKAGKQSIKSPLNQKKR